MDQSEKIGLARMAINARLLLLLAGIMLILNAITQSGRMGLGYLNFADLMDKQAAVAGEKAPGGAESMTERLSEAASANAAAEAAGAAAGATAAEGEAEMMTEPDPEAIATMFLEAGVTSGDMRLVGIASLVAAVFEIWVGAVCVLFSNRVNRYRVLLCATSALLIVEAIYLIILILKKSFILSAAMWSIALPLVLLWCALRFRKLSLADPERVYAIDKNQQPAPEEAAPPTVSNKSLRDRAMMNLSSEADGVSDLDDDPEAKEESQAHDDVSETPDSDDAPEAEDHPGLK